MKYNNKNNLNIKILEIVLQFLSFCSEMLGLVGENCVCILQEPNQLKKKQSNKITIKRQTFSIECQQQDSVRLLYQQRLERMIESNYVTEQNTAEESWNKM